jgi:uncharacterized protein (DUF427 family)
MKIERIKPGPGQESVWDHPRPPRWEACPKAIKVVVNGVKIVESNQAKRVLETSHPPVYYIPPADIRMEYLEPSQKQSWCEWKGKAGYFDVVVRDRKIENAAWAYSSPTPAFQAVCNHLAFYPHLMDTCFVDDEQVEAQAGGFYGGWVTQNV